MNTLSTITYTSDDFGIELDAATISTLLEGEMAQLLEASARGGDESEAIPYEMERNPNPSPIALCTLC
uniref:Putative peptide pheromone n=1 Tax=Coprinellus disseminatus TaxID=71703 RepID=Q1WMU4_COPDI|nr:putative peptide pheromone [Coprinellus disseminatus]